MTSVWRISTCLLLLWASLPLFAAVSFLKVALQVSREDTARQKAARPASPMQLELRCSCARRGKY